MTTDPSLPGLRPEEEAANQDGQEPTEAECAGAGGVALPEGLPAHPWASSAAEVARQLDVSPEDGLDRGEVRGRRRTYGANCLPAVERATAWQILLSQFKSLVVLLLVAAAGVAFAFREWVEGIAIAVVVIINAAIGFTTEIKATRSMESLQRLGHQSTTVRRSRHTRALPARALVPGDIVVFEAGDVMPADLRLLEASRLQMDESALTGESAPVAKDLEPIPEDAPLAERTSMVFRGTAATRGSGKGIVVATGLFTEIGRIAALTAETGEEITPLEKRLDQLGRKLVWITLVIAVFVLGAGLLRGRPVLLMIETAIALAVATIPEGLPIVATTALARGLLRMARHNALINRLSAVETLGATTVICTDKTGTLTENRMTASLFHLPDGRVTVSGGPFDREGRFAREGVPLDPASSPGLAAALEAAVLCSNASLDLAAEDPAHRAVGDPMEVALLVAGAKAGLSRADLLDRLPEVGEEAFDPDRKLMATLHLESGRLRVAVKGAPEAVLAASTSTFAPGSPQPLRDDDRARWLEANQSLAADGLRVLALAHKHADTDATDPYSDLVFLGLVGLLDPPRTEVREPIASARSAGIRVIMVTGDQAPTARNIARALDLAPGDGQVITGPELARSDDLSDDERRRLLGSSIFARVSPEQKLKLVTLHQRAGSVVAMTGDGVNDAPALKRADIGIAMGRRGTQVAREAADMVLLDDAFATIVFAIRQGRAIFDNIRRFVFYLISCNVAEVLVVGLASIAGAPLPILPLQILLLNLVTDVFPALALGLGEGDPTIMERSPRDPKEPIITRALWLAIGGYGFLISAAVLGALALALLWLRLETALAVTVSFLTLAFAQLWHVFNMRDARSGLFRNDVTRNRYVWGALLLCVVLLLLALYLPPLAAVLDLHRPGLPAWGLVLGLSFLPLLGGQLAKILAGRTG